MQPRLPPLRLFPALALVLGLGLALGGCTIEVPTVTGPTFDLTSDTEANGPIAIDLDDDALMAKLGVDSPAEVHWLRKLPGVDLVGITPAVVPEEHDLLAAAMAELPDQLSIRPRLIIRTSIPPTAEHDDPFAVTRGPDVWIFDDTFSWDGGGVGRLTMLRVLAHEFAHVAQFEALDPQVVGDVAAGRSSDLSLVHSLLVKDFVEATGWTADPSSESGWRLDGPASTTYGATSPIEDLAESVALVVTGLGDGIPTTHRVWVEKWLGAPERVLAAGKPWAPGEAIEVLSGTPLYDVERVAQLAGTRAAEVLTYQLPATSPPAADLAVTVSLRLTERGLPGTMGRVDDESVLRFAGRFNRADGTIFWVELWDFRDAPGYANPPDGPALSYVVIYP